MSWLDDHFEAYEGDDEPRDEKICKRCGAGDLHWEEDENGWYLADDEGYLHECDEAEVQAVVLDHFADLTA